VNLSNSQGSFPLDVQLEDSREPRRRVLCPVQPKIAKSRVRLRATLRSPDLPCVCGRPWANGAPRKGAWWSLEGVPLRSILKDNLAAMGRL